MGVNKVTINNSDGEEEVLVDLSGDTVKPETLAEGETAHDASGEPIVGTMRSGGANMKPSDLKGTTYKLNDIIEGTFFWNIDFTSNGTSYNSMSGSTSLGIYSVSYDSTKVFQTRNGTSTWTNTANQYVEITGGIDATNPEAVEWFNTHGKLMSVDLSSLATVDKIAAVSFMSGGISGVSVEDNGINYYYDETEIELEDDLHYIEGWNSQLPIVAGNNIEFEVDDENNVVKINATGGGSSSGSNFEMPQIRFSTATGSTENETPMLYVDADNPLKLTVEIVGGGALQVGDQLQVCIRKRFSGCNGNNYRRKYKLQRFAEYVVTADDLDKKYLTVSVACEYQSEDKTLHHAHRGLFHDGMAGGIAPLYLRIRRPKGEMQSNGSGQTVDAEFSNIVTIWKHSIRGTQSIRIQ